MKIGARIGFGVLCLVLLAWVTSLVVGFDLVADVHPEMANAVPDSAAWLGRDHMGRDVFWRLITASEAFVGPGLLACLVAVVLGLPSGALAGAHGGVIAAAIRYAYTVLGAVPRFVLVLLCCAIYGNEPHVLAITAGAAYAPTLGEAVYGRISRLRRADFILACRAHGLTEWDILVRHLVWIGCRDLVWRHLLSVFGYILILETTLSYLGGFGVQEPAPSWGNMLAFEFATWNGNDMARIAPTLAIWLTVLATVLAGRTFAERVHGR